MNNKPAYLTSGKTIYSYTKKAARELRNRPTKAEKVLWSLLRDREIGYKFRRQHIIAKFIVDFVCIEKKLVIEVDGKMHNLQREADQERTRILESLGLKVIRFSNEEVINKIEKILQRIKNFLEY